MIIERKYYLDRLIERKHDGYVKIITGIRRCGKSFLLNTLFRQHLLSCRVRPGNIITIELDRLEHEELRDPRKLSSYIHQCIKSSRSWYYILIDEIQMCEEVPSSIEGSNTKITFYDVLNGLLRMPNLDIYVTGSNSKMLSDDVATHFRDRGKIIRLYPLSFSEYYPVSGLTERQALEKYLLYGGMPEAVLSKTDEARRKYLASLFQTLYLRDIMERNHLKDDVLLGYIVDVLMSSVGSLTNLTNLVNTLQSTQKIASNINTVKSYITYLQQAYIFEKAERYDVRGRKYLSYPSKYYVEDVGLRNARLNYRQTEYTHLMENVIYNELISRGAQVDVGVVEIETRKAGVREKGQHEIDFVVNMGLEKIYIQSAWDLSSDAKRTQETLSLRHTKDSFRKLVVTTADQPFYTDDSGISYIGIISFLLDKSILDNLCRNY
ncbi:MAG: ATP-binding protein [Victivallales bacterium]|nr:ATP-binding protein [Victivallales bacterium]